MIKQLRYKFMAVTMFCISLLFIVILLVINISMTYTAQRQGYEMLEKIAVPPAFPNEEKPDFSPFRNFSKDHNESYQDKLRIFSVSFNKDGSTDYIEFNEKSGLSEEKILDMGKKAYAEYQKTSQNKGAVSTYLYRVTAGTETRIYFLDYTLERSFTGQLFNLCLIVGLIGITVLLAAVWILSGWMVKPVADAFEKQKQFIADASHELKTPLTIINANAEVLAATNPQSRWISNILDQTMRMNALIKDLLELAKMDAFSQKDKFQTFDLSQCVSSAALSFESVAFESHKIFEMQISENIFFKGNEDNIRQLVTTLLDNAFKYTDKNGKIEISLTMKNDKKILTVSNSGKGIQQKDQKHIFERFYRCDNSRSREHGGYGLGLSIAETIAKAHRGHINVKSDGESYTTFMVVFP